MTKKTSAARAQAFFKALSETGNQTIAAERACVSQSWVTLHRSTDSLFKVRMEAAIAEARERLAGQIRRLWMKLGAISTASSWWCAAPTVGWCKSPAHG